MGTRSTVKFYSEFDKETPILSVYQQYDGYINGVGYDLANFLKDKKVVNGFGSHQTMSLGYANGMGCLAAQYVAAHKKEIGGFYLTNPDDEQEYNYEVRFVNDKIEISVEDFVGSPKELLNYRESKEGDEPNS